MVLTVPEVQIRRIKPMPTSPHSSKHKNPLAPNPAMDNPQSVNPENPLHHIVRHDMEADGINDWQVIATRGGVLKGKRFNDSKYGGKVAALQAAIRYRNELLTKIDHFAHQIWLRTQVRRNNTSGIPGVGRRKTRANSNPNGRYVSWVAYWIDEHGIGRQRNFSVSRYGDLEAKQLAIAEREFQLKRVCAAKGSHWSDPFCTQNRKL